jgi:beta-glucosidase
MAPGQAGVPEPGAFPPGFIWGTATSAYQIEGAAAEDGRGPSVWDAFSHVPGKVQRGETGDTAADHYHRWAEDVDLMARLGLGAYRFSVSWPRVQPTGRGAVNEKGMAFYDRLVDALLARGIEPFVALSHFDLPQALEDRGGWAARDTAYRFAEYAALMARRLGDRVAWWMPHNEPGVPAANGYFRGIHAPGRREPMAAMRAVHFLLLSHGLAVQAIRSSAARPAKVGVALGLNPVHPATPSDRGAARRYDTIGNRLFLDAILLGRYPRSLEGWLVSTLARAQAGDAAVIGSPLDYVGINYYSRALVKRSLTLPLVWAAKADAPAGAEMSAMWEIFPQGMHEIIMRVWREYRPRSIIVTENGVPQPDRVDPDGRVRDDGRISYLARHLAQVQRAMGDGAPVHGYFVWSLLDNFEWDLGYSMRFGLIHVDFETLRRTVKDSGWWYRDLIAASRAAGAPAPA